MVLGGRCFKIDDCIWGVLWSFSFSSIRAGWISRCTITEGYPNFASWRKGWKIPDCFEMIWSMSWGVRAMNDDTQWCFEL